MRHSSPCLRHHSRVLPKSRSITSAPSCRTGRSSCRYTVSVTWLLAWPGKPCDLLDRHAIVGQQRDERVPQVPRRPVPARPGPPAHVPERLPDVPGTQRCPANAIRQPPAQPPGPPATPSAPPRPSAPALARRDLGVLVSPPARSARSTATDGGSPSRSTSCSQPIAWASSGRTPAIRLTTMWHASARPDAAAPSALRAAPVPVVPAVGAPWGSKGMLPWPLGTLPPSGSMH